MKTVKIMHLEGDFKLYVEFPHKSLVIRCVGDDLKVEDISLNKDFFEDDKPKDKRRLFSGFFKNSKNDAKEEKAFGKFVEEHDDSVEL